MVKEYFLKYTLKIALFNDIAVSIAPGMFHDAAPLTTLRFQPPEMKQGNWRMKFPIQEAWETYSTRHLRIPLPPPQNFIFFQKWAGFYLFSKKKSAAKRPVILFIRKSILSKKSVE